MKSNPFDGIIRLSVPTPSDIQRRMVELTGKQLQLEPRTQLQTRPVPSTPPPPIPSPNPILVDAALYGVAGLAVCGLTPHSEAHPVAILLQLLAARCLWTAVQRSQCLPEGGNLDAHELSAVAAELSRALDWVGDAHTLRLVRDDEARALWHDRYPALRQVRPGLYGAATSRAEAQVLRLSALYAVLDCSPIIGLPHLQAALAVWDYCSASASLFFGTSTGDHTADRILEAINASTAGCLSRMQITALFHGRLSSSRIEAALEQLISLGAIYPSTQPSRGRPSTLWSAIPESYDGSTTEETTNQESMQGQT